MPQKGYGKLINRIACLVIVISSLLGQVPSAQAADLLVLNRASASVSRYNGQTGAFINTFVPAGSGGLSVPYGLAFGPDGNLYASSSGSNSLLRYNGQTGAFIDAFVPPGSGLAFPEGFAFGPDGNLYVSSPNSDEIFRYNGQTGAFIDIFVPAGSGGLDRPVGIRFGPDGNLYVSSFFTHQILRYNGQTGAFINDFVSAGSGGVFQPTGLVFGPDGNLYVSGRGNDAVLRYNGKTGAFIDHFVPPASGGLLGPHELAFGPDGNLYVCGQFSKQILRYNGKTGAFINAFVPAGSPGLDDPIGLAFTPPGPLKILSGKGWLSTANPGAGLDWTTVGFDDRGWIPAFAPYPNCCTTADENVPGTKALFMWYWDSPNPPDGTSGPDVAYFRYKFSIPLGAKIVKGTAFAAVDDDYELYVNGKLAFKDQPGIVLDSIDFTQFLKPGENVIAIRAVDTVGAFEWVFFDGSIQLATQETINDLVTFVPRTSTYRTISNTAGCPSGFLGKFSFDARLTNKTSTPPLSDLVVQVKTLTNGNLLQNADGGNGGEGSTLTVLKKNGYSDGILSRGEFVDVNFSICLKENKPFTFFVDVLGTR